MLIILFLIAQTIAYVDSELVTVSEIQICKEYKLSNLVKNVPSHYVVMVCDSNSENSRNNYLCVPIIKSLKNTEDMEQNKDIEKYDNNSIVIKDPIFMKDNEKGYNYDYDYDYYGYSSVRNKTNTPVYYLSDINDILICVALGLMFIYTCMNI